MAGPAAKRMRRRALEWPAGARWAIAAAYFAVVNWLMLAPGKTFEDVYWLVPHEDKLAHAGVFLLLVLLVRWALPVAGGGGSLRYAVLAALALYPGSIELLQPLLGGAGRQFEWLDMASNYAGALLGWVVFSVALARK